MREHIPYRKAIVPADFRVFLYIRSYNVTRKRAIAKALQLKGHSDFAPVDLAYYQHFLDFFAHRRTDAVNK